MKKILKTVSFTLALSLGIWTLAVTFSPISSNFQAGAEVSATAFNTLFTTINDNFNAAKAAIESNETAISANTTAITSNAEAITSLQSSTDSSVKASAVLSRCDAASSNIVRSFNNEAETTITVADGVATGRCVIDFGFDISNSYWQVSPILTPVITGASALSGCTPGVGANNTKLFCNSFTFDGVANPGTFILTIF